MKEAQVKASPYLADIFWDYLTTGKKRYSKFVTGQPLSAGKPEAAGKPKRQEPENHKTFRITPCLSEPVMIFGTCHGFRKSENRFNGDRKTKNCRKITNDRKTITNRKILNDRMVIIYRKTIDDRKTRDYRRTG